MTNTKFITTTLPYVNSVPHIGHAFEFILGDALSKWFKSSGINVHFNIGLDEHGAKVWDKAKECGVSPEEHIESLTKIWKDFSYRFNIEWDSFYKTSDKSHIESVQKIWTRFVDRGDIYKSFYKGKYCKGCESQKQDSDLIHGKCPDHPTTEIESIEEENYFFKLSKYRDGLKSWIDQNPNFLEPKSKLDELKNLINESSDISVSRSLIKCPWGVPVPNDSSQIIYVWFDALLNYILAAGYLTNSFIWDDVVQLCGPDNLRFQAIFFQSFLESEGINKSGKLLVHGIILDKSGHKISKSIGNVIDPLEQLEKYGLDPVRYYSLNLSTYTDSPWNEEDLTRIWNSKIVNDWGNLISRVLHLIDIKCNTVTNLQPEDDFVEVVNDYQSRISNLWSNYHIKDALRLTNELVKFGNKYINDNKTWSSLNFELELSNLKYLLITVNKLYFPVFGSTHCNEISNFIDLGKKQIIFSKI